MKQARSITETPNFLSADIDLASPDAIVRILRQTDAQIFAGYLGYPSFFDPEIIEVLEYLARRAAQTLANQKGRIVLSGAGTSGRLAMFAATAFNRVNCGAAKKPFHYLMAGGDAALIQAQEGAEDDPKAAQADLARCISEAEDVFYVGITCGMSAPYIASQLEQMLQVDNGFAVLMGFNPVQLARDTPIENWPYTFLDTATRVAHAPNAAVLNPVVGPEPITGSTRMKSGSATKILLEVMFQIAFEITKGDLKPADAREMIIKLLLAYENAYRNAYLPSRELAKLISMGGSALRNGCHIYYLGASGIEEGRTTGPNAGLIGLIDASECPPTYGASFEDVRGYVHGGWRALLPGEKADYSSLGPAYQISIPDFEREKLPNLQESDLCVFLGEFPGWMDLAEKIRAKNAKTAIVTWNRDRLLNSNCDAMTLIYLDPMQNLLQGFALLEFQIKLIANALTTGAHVLSGKVFGNRMVDLRISNNKLFHRTVTIICDLIKISSEEATEALMRSIYQTDYLTDKQREKPISDYIEAARSVDKVVPKALLMATGKFTYGDAAQALRKNPVVRSVIEQFVK
jgi:N-acetylmuramic acid 6-phosphate (MurNAc-6-P) etherase